MVSVVLTKGGCGMIGRQVIVINKTFTLQELEQFMQENWDKEQYNDFGIGKPTSLSVDEYILLPATQRYLVIVYPKNLLKFSDESLLRKASASAALKLSRASSEVETTSL